MCVCVCVHVCWRGLWALGYSSLSKLVLRTNGFSSSGEVGAWLTSLTGCQAKLVAGYTPS